jgi:hypothetical protein
MAVKSIKPLGGLVMMKAERPLRVGSAKSLPIIQIQIDIVVADRFVGRTNAH